MNANVDKENETSINELMATEVMGWEFFEYKDPFDSRQSEYREDGLIGVITFKHAWNPTTDMNQAMECLQEFRKADKDWESCELEMPKRGYFRLVKGKGFGQRVPLETSAPLAICKAILKAKGIDI